MTTAVIRLWWRRGGVAARLLRGLAVVTLLTSTFLLALMLWPGQAFADNCSEFTDCFGQSGAASEATLGLMLLSMFSIALDFVPVVGDIKGLAEAVTGRDLLTGEELAGWERVAGVIGVIPGADVLRLIGRLGDGADVAVDMARHGDEFADFARHAGEGTGVGRGVDDLGRLAGRGTELGGVASKGDRSNDLADLADGLPGATRPRSDTHSRRDFGEPGGRQSRSGSMADSPRRIDPPPPERGAPAPLSAGSPVPQGARQSEIDSLRKQYDATSTPSERRKLSEQIGELGGVAYLEHSAGRPLEILRPTSTDDVADLVTKFDNNEAWDVVVAYRGRNATNLVHFDGTNLNIVEAKGGAGKYSNRKPVIQGSGTTRISQTDPDYPKQIATAMTKSSRLDGRNQIGRVIRMAYRRSNVTYEGVRTAGHERNGAIQTILEDVFIG